jgi:hypothetical protein
LTDRLSGHAQRLTSTGVLLQRLERQLREELLEAANLAEVSWRGAASPLWRC